MARNVSQRASSRHTEAPLANSPEHGTAFPAFLKGKKILLVTEFFGPVNRVSWTTLSLIEYLRDNRVHLAVAAPTYQDNTLRWHIHFAMIGFAHGPSSLI